MTRFKFEFPTEWSLCPDGVQDEWQQPSPETSAKAQTPATVEPGVEQRVLAAGAPGSR